MITKTQQWEQRRRLGVQRVQEGWSKRAVADFLGVSVRAVQMWCKAFRERGPAGLAASRRRGRPPKLTRRQERTVLRWISCPPTEFGFRTDLWTAGRLASLITRRFHVQYHPRYMCQWLARRRITPQRPHARPRERNDKSIRQWLAHDWPRLKKTL